MLKLIMAVSADGFLARGPDDDMRWTGKTDKKLFRLLTSVGAVCGAGTTTWRQMPELKGRRLVPISRQPGQAMKPTKPLTTGMLPALERFVSDSTFITEPLMTLGQFAHSHPGAWLIGGPTVALEALDCNLVNQVYLCRSTVHLFEGMRDTVTPFLENAGSAWGRAKGIDFDDVSVDVWSRKDGRRP